MKIYLTIIYLICFAGTAYAKECTLGGTKFFNNSSVQQDAIINAGGSCGSSRDDWNILITPTMQDDAPFCTIYFDIFNKTDINFSYIFWDVNALDRDGYIVGKRSFFVTVRPNRTGSDRVMIDTGSTENPCNDIDTLILYGPSLTMYDYKGDDFSFKSGKIFSLTKDEDFTRDEFYELIMGITDINSDPKHKTIFKIE